MVEAAGATATTATFDSKTVLTFDNLTVLESVRHQFPKENDQYGGVGVGNHLKISRALSWKKNLPENTTGIAFHCGSIDKQNFIKLHLRGIQRHAVLTIKGDWLNPWLWQFEGYRGNPPTYPPDLDEDLVAAFVTVVINGDLKITKVQIGTKDKNPFDADDFVYGVIRTPGTGMTLTTKIL